MSIVSTLTLPVRWWSDQQTFGLRDLVLSVQHTAFLLIDCDGLLDESRYDTDTKVHVIAPALQTARQYGVRFITHLAVNVAQRMRTVSSTGFVKGKIAAIHPDGNQSDRPMRRSCNPAIRMPSSKKLTAMGSATHLPINIPGRGVSIPS